MLKKQSRDVYVRKMYTYCGRWFDLRELTSLHEKNKSFVLYYCDTCLPEVQSNLRKMSYSHLFRFGERGKLS
jgi:hypothetical protein